MTRKRRRPQAGLTLVELMITLIVAALVTSSTFVFFAGQQNVYDAQTKILNVQQNLWAAMETLTRNVRASGTGMVGCVRPDSDKAGPDTGDPPPGTNGVAPPQTGLRAFSLATGTSQRLAPLWIQNGAAGAPDRLTIVYGNGTSGNWVDTTLVAPVATTIDPILVTAGTSAAFRMNEFVLLLDAGPPAAANWDRGCTLLQLTSIVTATDSLIHAATSPWNPAISVPSMMLPTPYQAGVNGGVRNFGQLVWVQFFIDTTQPYPRLMMNRLDTTLGPQVLAEGVEDLQVAYACDRLPAGPPAGDGVFSEGTDVATRLADEWVFNVAGDPIPASCNQPQAVRITLIARSDGQDDSLRNNVSNFKPAVEDGVAGAPDATRHRTITTTVYPRNR